MNSIVLFARQIACLLALAAAGICAEPALNITGDVSAPMQLAPDDLAKMPRETVTFKEEKGGSSRYEGIPLREVLARAGAPLGKEMRGKALASYVVAKARDGYQVVFGLSEIDADLGNASILVADKRDGKPLGDNLGPFRLVCPHDKRGARSVRMLTTLEVVRLRK